MLNVLGIVLSGKNDLNIYHQSLSEKLKLSLLCLKELNMDVFEELFKTKAQSAPVDVGTLKVKVTHKASSKITLLEPNRAKNLAITLRKGGMSTAQICTAIQSCVQQTQFWYNQNVHV